jgi:zinc protease
VGGIANLLSGSVFYGENHPLGRVPSDASLAAVSLDDCKAWAKDWFKPQGAQLWLSGDVTPAQVKELTGRIFKGWKGKPKASVKVGKPTPRKGRIFFVDVPGAAQSQVQVVFPGPERKAKDYFANTIVSDVLAGGFTSRINMNIREDKGYAYGAGGSYGYNPSFGTFRAGGQIRTDVTDKAVIEIYKEISKMATGDITDTELAQDKTSIIQSLPASFETSGRVLDALKSLVYFGLPLDYYAKMTKSVEAIDKKAAAKAAKDHVKPKDVIVFVVGDASVVLPGLQKLHADKTVGDGDLVILDADGKVVGNR